MYFPTTRVLTVLELLQSRQQMSGPELAARLEVDTRTIRRYVTMLQDLGIPVEAGRGRYGAYRLRPGFKLPPLMFSDEEALGMTLGLLAAQKMRLVAAAPAVEGALAKIERVLPAALRERVQAVQETLVLDFTPARASAIPDNEVVVTLCTAAQQKRQVMLGYRAYEAAETTRRVDPYGLVYRASFWYMAGYCHLRADLRLFRLDRVTSVAMGDEVFERPADFDCLVFVLQSLPHTPDTWLVEVLLEATLEEAQRIVPPALATLEQVAEGVMLRCYVGDLAWMALQLVNLCCSLVVLQPAELREALQQLAQRVAKLAACKL